MPYAVLSYESSKLLTYEWDEFGRYSNYNVKKFEGFSNVDTIDIHEP
jgi:hypothetical protein